MVVNVLHQETKNRRKFMKSLGAASAVGLTGLAGCMGQGSDITTIRMATSGEDTSAYAMSQGMAAVIDEHSDSLSLDARPADGSFQAMVQMDQGGIDIAYTDILNAYNIHNEQGDYADDPFENQIYEVLHYYDLQVGYVTTADTGVETIGDLEDVQFSPGPAGSGTRLTAVEHLRHGVDSFDQLDTVSLGFSAGGQALNEGRVAAVPDIRLNGWSTPSYIEELHSINDNTQVVHWPDEVVESIQNDDRLVGDYYGPDTFEGPEYPHSEEWFPTTVFNLYTTDSLEDDVVNEMLTVLWENIDDLKEYHALLEDWDADFLSNLTEQVPTHPSTESFFSDIS